MAIEILVGRYLHYNAKASRHLKSWKPDWDFHSNALHDIEPYIWMLLWCLFFQRPNPSNPIDLEQLGCQLDTSNNIFVDGSKHICGHPSALRIQCLSAGVEMLGSLLADIPEDFKTLGLNTCMTDLVVHMVSCYEELEELPNFNGAHTVELLTSPLDWVYDGFEEIFNIYLLTLRVKPMPIVSATQN